MDIVVAAFLFLLCVYCIGVAFALFGIWLGRVFIFAIGGLNHDCIVYDRCDYVKRRMAADESLRQMLL